MVGVEKWQKQVVLNRKYSNNKKNQKKTEKKGLPM